MAMCATPEIQGMPKGDLDEIPFDSCLQAIRELLGILGLLPRRASPSDQSNTARARNTRSRVLLGTGSVRVLEMAVGGTAVQLWPGLDRPFSDRAKSAGQFQPSGLVAASGL